METVTLERMKMVALKYITPELAEHFAIAPKVDISAHASWLSDDIAIRFVQMVYGRTMDKVEVQYPADWWEAVKERWLPTWAKARWPVRYKATRLEAKEYYPKLAMPDRGPQLQLYRHDYPGRIEDLY